MTHHPSMISKKMQALVHHLGGGRPYPIHPTDPTGLALVTLHLARCEEYPDGNSRCGYQIWAPFDAENRLDANQWDAVRTACLVRRFWDGEEDRMGRLVHRAGGRHGATWALDFVGEPTMTEAGRNWQDHVFKTDEYVSIENADGRLRTFKVVQLRMMGRDEQALAPATDRVRRPLSGAAAAPDPERSDFVLTSGQCQRAHTP